MHIDEEMIKTLHCCFRQYFRPDSDPKCAGNSLACNDDSRLSVMRGLPPLSCVSCECVSPVQWLMTGIQARSQ